MSGLGEAIAAGTEAFLRAWYGDPGQPIDELLGEYPEALRLWWSWEQAWSHPLTHQNRVLGPDEVFLDGPQTVFYVENQDVVVWGYGPDSDTIVSERVNDETSPWASLEEFLCQVAVFEATFGPHGLAASQVSDEELTMLVSDLDELHGQVWHGARFFLGDRLLINAGREQADGSASKTTWTVVASAPTPAGLSQVETQRRWDYDSRTES